MKTLSSHKSKVSYSFRHWALPTYFWILQLLCWICLAADQQPPSNFTTNKDNSAYSDCASSKTQSCVGIGGTDCIKTKSCVILVTYYVTDNGGLNNSGNRVYFQVIMQQEFINYIENYYLAVGISTDEMMGDDIVMSCNQFKKSAFPFSVQLSYNPSSKRENIFATDSKTQSLLVKDEMLVMDGKTYCSFSIPAQLSVGPTQMNLNSTSLHLLIAVGNVKSIQVLKHHQHRYFTSKPLNFRLNGQQVVISDSESKRKIFMLGHLTLMILTFLTINPTSMLIVRFFKESHVKQRVCHKKLWFILHLFGVGAAIACITLSLSLITTYAGVLPHKGISKYLAHYCIGIIIVTLYVIQILLGCYLGVSLVDSYTFVRGVGSNIHFINGSLIQVLSLVQIFLAAKIMSSRLKYCSTGSIILIVWIGVYFCAYAALTAIMLRSDMAEFKLLTVKDEINYHAEKNNDDGSNLDGSGYVPENDSTWDGFRKDGEATTSSKNDSIGIDSGNALKQKHRPHRVTNTTTTPKLKQNSGTSNEVGGERRPSVSKSVRIIVKKTSSRSAISKKVSRLSISKMSPNSKPQQQSLSKQNQHLPKNKIPPLSTTGSGSVFSANLQLHRQSSKHTGSSEKPNKGSSPKSGSRKSGSRGRRSGDAADREHNIPNPVASKKSRTQSKLGDDAFLVTNKSNKVGPDLVPHSPHPPLRSKIKSRNSKISSEFDAQSSYDVESEVENGIDLNHEESPPRSLKNKNVDKAHHQKLSGDIHIPSVNKPLTKKKGGGGGGASVRAGAPIDIVPRRKQIIYDEYPDYDNETVVSTPTAYRSTRKVTSKRMKHDPRRALTTYPLHMYFTREHPKTQLLDTIIASFFVTSLVMSVGLVYSLSPYDGHGMDHCESESWMSDFP